MIAGSAGVLHFKADHPKTIHWVCKFRPFIDVRLYQFWDQFLAIDLSMLTLAANVAFKETMVYHIPQKKPIYRTSTVPENTDVLAANK